MEPVDQLLQFIQSTPNDILLAIVFTLLGIGDVYRQYKRTGRIRLVSLPWRWIKRLIFELRRNIPLFTHPKPTERIRHLSTDLETFKERVAKQSYEPQWPLAFYYQGEDLNCRRYYYDESEQYPHRQMHIRAWDTADGIEICAHDEPAPIQHPRAHVGSKDMYPATQWVMGNQGDLDPSMFTRPK